MRAVLVVVAALSIPAAAQGQSSACYDADVVFVGRADRAVTFHISGETAIKRARENVERVKAEVARERASLDPQTRLDRDIELEVRIIKAEWELDRQQARYLAPHDVTVFPMRVEDGIRGVTEPTVMLLTRHLQQPLEPDQSYLVIGHRNGGGVVPPLPDLAHLDYLNSSIEANRVVPIASAQKEVAFLATTRSGATILGTLERHSWGNRRPPSIGGARVVISSGGHGVETVTNEDGSFAVSGIPAGRIEIRPVLPANLTVFNRSALTRVVSEGACVQVGLTAEVDGRVRGRIISASSRPIRNATIHLNSINLAQFWLDPGVPSGPHAPRLNVTAAEDGMFEFVGVPAGNYLLMASVRQIVDGKERTLTTFYPGTSELSSAHPLTVGEATHHDGFDFVVRME